MKLQRTKMVAIYVSPCTSTSSLRPTDIKNTC